MHRLQSNCSPKLSSHVRCGAQAEDLTAVNARPITGRSLLDWYLISLSRSTSVSLSTWSWSAVCRMRICSSVMLHVSKSCVAELTMFSRQKCYSVETRQVSRPKFRSRSWCPEFVLVLGVQSTKYLTTILWLSYDNARVTIDMRRSSNLQNIPRRTQYLS